MSTNMSPKSMNCHTDHYLRLKCMMTLMIPNKSYQESLRTKINGKLSGDVITEMANLTFLRPTGIFQNYSIFP